MFQRSNHPDSSSLKSARSVRFETGALLLMPFFVVLLAFGFSEGRRVTEYREASELSNSTSRTATLIIFETALRHEWLSAIDIATIETTDFVLDSETTFARATALGEETALAFKAAADATDQEAMGLDGSLITNEAIERLERLITVRSRVLELDITAAEIDLFYSRLVLEISQSNQINLAALESNETPQTRLDATQQQLFSEAISSTGVLQQQLTRAVEDLVAARPSDWGAIERSSITAKASIEALDTLSTSRSAMNDLSPLLLAAYDAEEFSIAEQTAPSGDEEALQRILELREEVVRGTGELVDEFGAITTDIVNRNNAVRSAALRTMLVSTALLAVSGILILLAIARLARTIGRPLMHIAHIAAKVSQGNLDVNLEIPVDESPQEVQLVSSALADLIGTVSLIEHQAVAMSEGKLDSPVLDERLPGQLGRSLESSIGRWRDTSQQVQVSNMITAAINKATSDAQLRCDGELKILEANPAAELLFDLPQNQLLGKSLPAIASMPVLDGIDELGANGTVTDSAFVRTRAGDVETLATITRVTTETGRVHSVLLRDVSDRQQILDRLSFEVQHDRLTGLRTRQSFADTLQRCLDRESTGVLVVDINDFNNLNSIYGEWAGDQVLHVLADRLSNGLPEVQQLARLGADEFAISVHADDFTVLQELADIIHRLVGQPIRVADQQIEIAVSIGAALAQSEAPDSVIAEALLATRHAKDEGGNCTVVYDAELDSKIATRRKVESDLQDAIRNDELELAFQPVVTMQDQRIVGAEVLLRWPQPDGTQASPESFISLAEECGLILEVDCWVIEQTCRFLSEVVADAGADFHVAINVSGRHLADGDLVAAVRKACESWNVNPSRLAIEVTESVLLADRHTSQRVLDELSNLGVALLIDDFGTGYSNLAYLQDFPFDTLKIDRSFVSRSDVDEQGKSLVNALVGLGRAMGMAVHAEGVETVRQRTILQELGCDFEQGFLFSKPLPKAEFLSLWAHEMRPIEMYQPGSAPVIGDLPIAG